MDTFFEADAWTASAFKSLDFHAKGYLYKGEILSLIIDQGV